MSIESVSLPDIMSKEITALIKAGYYNSKSDVVKDALRVLMEHKSNLRIASAVEMFKMKQASLSKCAEIAGVSTIKFKDILADRGIIREIKSKDLHKETSIIKRLRK